MRTEVEINSKLKSIQNILLSKDKGAMLLEKQNNMCWLLRGRSFVNLASVIGVVDVLINSSGIYLITNNIEAKRMINEEFICESLTVKEYNWYESERRKQIIDELSGGSYITDSECENDIKALRTVMTEDEKKDYIELGKDTAEVMQQACFEVTKGMSEYKIASMIGQKCMERGIDPVVVLVAADERINLYRHPLPTTKVLDDYAMLVLNGRRYGLTSCLTRFVAFSDPSDDTKKRRDAVMYIDSMLLKNTRPGISTSVLFDLTLKEYKEQGYKEEWKLHHQGGLTGYLPREYRVSSDVDVDVKTGQVYSWNPSITGFKAEDTFIVEDYDNIVVTDTKELPYRAIRYKESIVNRPDILVRKAYR